MPNGLRASREIIDHGGVIAVIPVLENGQIVMVRQFRLAAAKITLEVPAGRMNPHESARQAVHRELREETGYRAKKIRKLISFYPAIGYSNERIHLFIATGLTPGEQDPDEDEMIEIEILTLKQAISKIKAGKIIDSKSILALLYTALYELMD